MVVGEAKRAGLVATNSIRGGLNRRVLDRIEETPGQAIFDARSDEDWISDGAAVRVSTVCFGQPPSGSCQLNGREVQAIHADLTGAGLDLTRARRLSPNFACAFIGTQKTGPFDIPGEIARKFLLAPTNPNQRRNADVVRPWWNGLDVVRRPRDMWIVDFGPTMAEADAALYEAPFEYVLRHVKPVRDANSSPELRASWWRLWRARGEFRAALVGRTRYIATARVAKYRLFMWCDAAVLPDTQIVAIARGDDTSFGILHSRFHEAWALRLGTSLEDRPRYTPTTTFEAFPFPDGLTPARQAVSYADDPRAQAIAAAARRLHYLRENWLNPPDLIRREPEVVPGFPDRILPRDEAAARELAKRTLTALYNARPRWLADAHATLDAAVAAAYGWPANISDEDALARLLSLNLERAREDILPSRLAPGTPN